MDNIKSRRLRSLIGSMFIDAIGITLTYLLVITTLITLNLEVERTQLMIALPIIIAVHLLTFYLIGVYKMLVSLFGFEDFLKLTVSIVGINILIVIFIALTKIDFIYKTSYIYITITEVFILSIPRVVNRFIMYFRRQFTVIKTVNKKVIIFGAGYVGERLLKEIYREKELTMKPVAFIDEDQEKTGKRIMGVPIIGSIDKLEEAIVKYQAEEVVIAINHITNQKVNEIAEIAFKHHLKIRRFIGMTSVDEESSAVILKDVKIEDLLNRKEITLENDKIKEFIKDEVVLVTGGGGSIGSELCRQIAQLNPKQLIIFDIYENNAYDIQQELLRKFKKEEKELNLKVIIGSVYNYERIKDVFETYHPTIVFHAAAYKHVPLMEDSAVEAIRTNVLGTHNTAKLSNLYKVKKFVLVSSDKAVRSTNVMGATKRYAELIIENQQAQSDFTKFSAVRFGNVLGSNGSVIPLFKKQIEDGGPVTVTHKEITRYFMTIPEAVGLILQSAVFADGGEIFVLDMGDPVKIYTLAEQMISLSGLKPHQDIKIEVTGLRPGEKLYEELLVDVNSDNHCRTSNEKILIEKTPKIETEALEIEYIKENISKLTNCEAKKLVAKVVTTYQIKE